MIARTVCSGRAGDAGADLALLWALLGTTRSAGAITRDANSCAERIVILRLPLAGDRKSRGPTEVGVDTLHLLMHETERDIDGDFVFVDGIVQTQAVMLRRRIEYNYALFGLCGADTTDHTKPVRHTAA